MFNEKRLIDIGVMKKMKNDKLEADLKFRKEILNKGLNAFYVLLAVAVNAVLLLGGFIPATDRETWGSLLIGEFAVLWWIWN